MKKIISIILIMSALLSLASCKRKADTETDAVIDIETPATETVEQVNIEPDKIETETKTEEPKAETKTDTKKEEAPKPETKPEVKPEPTQKEEPKKEEPKKEPVKEEPKKEPVKEETPKVETKPEAEVTPKPEPVQKEEQTESTQQTGTENEQQTTNTDESLKPGTIISEDIGYVTPSIKKAMGTDIFMCEILSSEKIGMVDLPAVRCDFAERVKYSVKVKEVYLQRVVSKGEIIDVINLVDTDEKTVFWSNRLEVGQTYIMAATPTPYNGKAVMANLGTLTGKINDDGSIVAQSGHSELAFLNSNVKTLDDFVNHQELDFVREGRIIGLQYHFPIDEILWLYNDYELNEKFSPLLDPEKLSDDEIRARILLNEAIKTKTKVKFDIVDKYIEEEKDDNKVIVY